MARPASAITPYCAAANPPLERPLRRTRGLALALHANGVPGACVLPAILGLHAPVLRNRLYDAMPHRQRDIVFVEHQPRHFRHRIARHHFLNKHHAAARFVAFATPHVEAQVDLVEIRMQRNPGLRRLSAAQLPENRLSKVTYFSKTNAAMVLFYTLTSVSRCDQSSPRMALKSHDGYWTFLLDSNG